LLALINFQRLWGLLKTLAPPLAHNWESTSMP
jgi:hypothetical protein